MVAALLKLADLLAAQTHFVRTRWLLMHPAWQLEDESRLVGRLDWLGIEPLEWVLASSSFQVRGVKSGKGSVVAASEATLMKATEGLMLALQMLFHLSARLRLQLPSLALFCLSFRWLMYLKLMSSWFHCSLVSQMREDQVEEQAPASTAASWLLPKSQPPSPIQQSCWLEGRLARRIGLKVVWSL